MVEGERLSSYKGCQVGGLKVWRSGDWGRLNGVVCELLVRVVLAGRARRGFVGVRACGNVVVD